MRWKLAELSIYLQHGLLLFYKQKYGVPLGPSRFYLVISTCENTKVRRRKHESTKTKTRNYDDINAEQEDENSKTRNHESTWKSIIIEFSSWCFRVFVISRFRLRTSFIRCCRLRTFACWDYWKKTRCPNGTLEYRITGFVACFVSYHDQLKIFCSLIRVQLYSKFHKFHATITFGKQKNKTKTTTTTKKKQNKKRVNIIRKKIKTYLHVCRWLR